MPSPVSILGSAEFSSLLEVVLLLCSFFMGVELSVVLVTWFPCRLSTPENGVFKSVLNSLFLKCKDADQSQWQDMIAWHLRKLPIDQLRTDFLKKDLISLTF